MSDKVRQKAMDSTEKPHVRYVLEMKDPPPTTIAKSSSYDVKNKLWSK